MQQVNEQNHSTPPDVSEGPSIPVEIQPGQHLRGRPLAIIALTVLLAVVFGTGLFAGWAYGTRGSGSVPPASSSAVAISGTVGAESTLDALREAAIQKARPAVVQVQVVTSSGQGLGSGVILDVRGYVITNQHVVAGAQRIQVTLSDGVSLAAQLVGVDALDDLAVVKVSTSAKLTAAILADSSKVQVGQEVLVIGNPLGITQSVTSGIVSALDRAVSTIPDAIQTDAAINPGNSGGALVNLRGELVGIPTSTAINPQFQTPANGVGFAIPSNRVQFIARQLIETGKVTHTGRAAMGLQVTSVDASLATQRHLAVSAGALILNVAATSPAEVAGLRLGDVIVQIGPTQVTDATTYVGALLPLHPGEVVPVSIARGTERLTIRVTLGEAQAASSK